MLTALVLICSLAVTPDLRGCNPDNAVSVTRLDERFASPVLCFLHGEAYIADTAVGQDLADNERVKIVCAPAPRDE